jgi:uncharacterized protein YmfQ (DUF2313 family)
MFWGSDWSGFWGDECDETKYTHVLQDLLPTGPAWTRDPDAILTKLLSALAFEFARVECRVEDMLREADVRTAGELLPEWEAFADLPGRCDTPVATTQGRRDALHSKLTQKKNSSIPTMIEIAEKLGYTSVSIREDAMPFRVGFSAVGDPLQQGPWIYHFTVIGTRPPSLADDDQLNCLIDEAKQAHTTFGLEITP